MQGKPGVSAFRQLVHCSPLRQLLRGTAALAFLVGTGANGGPDAAPELPAPAAGPKTELVEAGKALLQVGVHAVSAASGYVKEMRDAPKPADDTTKGGNPAVVGKSPAISAPVPEPPPVVPAWVATLNEALNAEKILIALNSNDPQSTFAKMAMAGELCATLEKASEQGSTEADYRKAVILRKGLYGVPVSYADAVASLEKAVVDKPAGQRAYGPACLSLGRLCESGWVEGGVQKDWKKALILYEVAVQTGAPGAYGKMGDVWSQGLLGVRQDRDAAKHYYDMGVAQNDPVAMFGLGRMMLEAHPGDVKAIRLCAQGYAMTRGSKEMADFVNKTLISEIVEKPDILADSWQSRGPIPVGMGVTPRAEKNLAKAENPQKEHRTGVGVRSRAPVDKGRGPEILEELAQLRAARSAAMQSNAAGQLETAFVKRLSSDALCGIVKGEGGDPASMLSLARLYAEGAGVGCSPDGRSGLLNEDHVDLAMLFYRGVIANTHSTPEQRQLAVTESNNVSDLRAAVILEDANPRQNKPAISIPVGTGF